MSVSTGNRACTSQGLGKRSLLIFPAWARRGSLVQHLTWTLKGLDKWRIGWKFIPAERNGESQETIKVQDVFLSHQGRPESGRIRTGGRAGEGLRRWALRLGHFLRRQGLLRAFLQTFLLGGGVGVRQAESGGTSRGYCDAPREDGTSGEARRAWRRRMLMTFATRGPMDHPY